MIHSKRAVSFLAVALTAALVGSGCVAQPSAGDASDLAAPSSEEATDGPQAGAHGEEATAEAQQECLGGGGGGCFGSPFLNATDAVFRCNLGFFPFGFLNYGPLGFAGFGPFGCGCGGW